MRSGYFIVFMKKLRDKVSRKKINWWKVMVELGKPEIEHHYILLQSRLVRGRSMSSKRCAYYALKTYYSTTTQDELLQKISLDKLK